MSSRFVTLPCFVQMLGNCEIRDGQTKISRRFSTSKVERYQAYIDQKALTDVFQVLELFEYVTDISFK